MSGNKRQILLSVRPDLLPRINKLSDIRDWTDYLFQCQSYKATTLLCGLPKATVRSIITEFIAFVDSNSTLSLQDYVRHTLTSKFQLKMKAIVQPARVALTGKDVSLPLFKVIEVLGPTETKKRLSSALIILEEINND